MTPGLRRALVTGGVAAAVVAADQTSKTWALHHAMQPRHVIWTLRLAVTLNTGIAFSQATGSTTLVTVIAIGVLIGLLVVARRTRSTYTAVVLGLAIGGAVGNLADRLVRHHGGAVIDFIDLRWWPVFNVSDAAVTVGLLLAAGRALWPARGAQPEPAEPQPEPADHPGAPG
jgi:signal peptidase II